MIVRHNPDLDDAFGLPTVGQWEEARRLGIPVEQVPRPAPPPTLPPTSRRPTRRLTPDEEAFLAMLLADKESAERPNARPGATGNDSAPVATRAVLVRERQGEDLLFWDGRWWHRCARCGPRSPPFTTPRDEIIQHQPGCPNAGQF